MSRRLISSGSFFEKKAGFYSRALVDGAWCFVSGSTGLDVETGVLPDDIEEQCKNTLQTIERTLTEAGFSFHDVVRVTYILPDRTEFERCWPQLQAVFGEVRPPSTLLQAGLIDPKMRIEIEVTAYAPSKA
ncbi:RidA family protein [Pelagibius sp. Alg239-R121]|uniref:RidA family protein n=1 Tax=Pelagibius sp. Alg239-R121 TaxID=2993448 RepID=UPI0024A73F1D|nr:RidA family protein [Pelagibius sp. Alg239-R121]